MRPKQITAGLLSMVLLALLVWTFVGNAGDIRIQVLLGIGIVLGFIYTIYGQLPEWLINFSGGKIVADDDPSNISPRIYLPILGVVILIASLIMMVVIFKL